MCVCKYIYVFRCLYVYGHSHIYVYKVFRVEHDKFFEHRLDVQTFETIVLQIYYNLG